MSFPPAAHFKNRPSVELSQFSTMFQRWELGTGTGAEEVTVSPTSPTSRRSSHDLELELDSPAHAAARQRTTEACDKCRSRKTKCSGDHPVCERCTARGLLCHYSGAGRERGVRGAVKTKARLGTAIPASSLDLARFASDNLHPGSQAAVKQEDGAPLSPRYCPPQPQAPAQHQHFAFPGQPASPALDPPHYPSRIEISPLLAELYPLRPFLEHDYVRRRVQSHSALGAAEAEAVAYRRPPTQTFAPRPTSLDSRPNPSRSRLGPTSVVEFDLRDAPKLQKYCATDTDSWSSGSDQTRSANSSVFSANSHSSSAAESSELFRSASALDLRILNQVPQMQNRHHSLQIDARYAQFHSPTGSISSVDDLSSPTDVPVHVPQIKGKFRNPWVESQGPRVMVRAVELVCPSPLTPIRAGFYDYGMAESEWNN
ncbi:hypothetical protein C8R46DRAFT_1257721 [Mycena filopes]|nr:hypothetical protein C8R46DRAFT_1257721 [Mycena filopes]